MPHIDMTNNGRRPTAAQIVAKWKKIGRPAEFTVSYGESYAKFNYIHNHPWGPWFDEGNGCEGFSRPKVVDALKAAGEPAKDPPVPVSTMKPEVRRSGAVTIDEAIAVLTEAKAKMGGDRCLILSLTGSGFEEADINELVIEQDGESGYVQVRCNHPYIQERG